MISIELYWPLAFSVLVIFITIILIILHLLYAKLSETNTLLVATLASKSLLLQSNSDLVSSLNRVEDRETRLQKSLDNIINHRNELLSCLVAAKSDIEREECIKRIAESDNQ